MFELHDYLCKHAKDKIKLFFQDQVDIWRPYMRHDILGSEYVNLTEEVREITEKKCIN